ncbi:MAG: DUF4177 domain-containing protein [Paracoccaceae bacterium]
MSEYEYKAVPAPRQAKKVKGIKGIQQRYAHILTQAINAELAGGWEYYRSESLPVESKPGFLRSAVESYHALLIFRRAKGGVPVGVPAATLHPSDVEESTGKTRRPEPTLAPLTLARTDKESRPSTHLDLGPALRD